MSVKGAPDVCSTFTNIHYTMLYWIMLQEESSTTYAARGKLVW